MTRAPKVIIAPRLPAWDAIARTLNNANVPEFLGYRGAAGGLPLKTPDALISWAETGPFWPWSKVWGGSRTKQSNGWRTACRSQVSN